MRILFRITILFLLKSLTLAKDSDTNTVNLLGILYKENNATNNGGFVDKEVLEDVLFNEKSLKFSYVGDPGNGAYIYFPDETGDNSDTKQNITSTIFNVSLIFEKYHFVISIDVSKVKANEVQNYANTSEASLITTTLKPTGTTTKAKPSSISSSTKSSTRASTAVASSSTPENATTATTTASPKTTTPPSTISLNISVAYMKPQVQETVTGGNKNTGAVVVAVIEGLMLLAIVVFILYRTFGAPAKRRSEWQENATNDVTYRNQAFYDQPYQDRPVAYRADTDTVRTSQPTSTRQTSSPPQMTQSYGSSGVRVQTSTPALVPTSTTQPTTTSPTNFNPNRGPFTDPWNAQAAGSNQATRNQQNQDPFDLMS